MVTVNVPILKGVTFDTSTPLPVPPELTLNPNFIYPAVARPGALGVCPFAVSEGSTFVHAAVNVPPFIAATVYVNPS